MSMNRIRYLAKNALGGFATLDLETAAELAQADLSTILLLIDGEGVDRTDNAVPVSGVVPVEVGVRRKALRRDL